MPRRKSIPSYCLHKASQQAEELAPPSAYEALRTVAGLRTAGRLRAKLRRSVLFLTSGWMPHCPFCPRT
jgi:hypothetical protein